MKKTVFVSVFTTILTLVLIFGGFKLYQILKENNVFSKYYCWGENHILDDENGICRIPNVDYYVEQGHDPADLWGVFINMPEFAEYLEGGYSVNDISRMDLTYNAKKKGEKYYYCNGTSHGYGRYDFDETTNICTAYTDNTKRKVKYTYQALTRDEEYPYCDENHELNESANTCSYIEETLSGKKQIEAKGGKVEYSCPYNYGLNWTLEDDEGICVSEVVENCDGISNRIIGIGNGYDRKYKCVKDAKIAFECPEGYKQYENTLNCELIITYQAKTK